MIHFAVMPGDGVKKMKKAMAMIKKGAAAVAWGPEGRHLRQ